MATTKKGADLGFLQDEVERTAKTLKGAKTAFINAKQAMEKAEESYSNAQKALVAGVEQVKASTKVA